MNKLILASASPRRREILASAGFVFEVCPAQGEEKYKGSHPWEIVENLAAAKAEEVADRRRKENPDGEFTVIGADTIVTLDGEIMGKPKDREDARRMLSGLQGRAHQVYTGVAILDFWGDMHTFHRSTDVYVYPMDEKEIEGYLDRKEPYDKAGAYGIQGYFARYVEKICGDYLNVVGLPLSAVCQELKRLGLEDSFREQKEEVER